MREIVLGVSKRERKRRGRGRGRGRDSYRTVRG
jgi:hypothetical protein